MKVTRSMKNAIKNNIPVVDCHVTLFTDSFNQNLFDAIDVQFNKHEFDIEKSQMFFSSKDLDIEKTKNYLEKKGIASERIEVVENWSQMPLLLSNLDAYVLSDIFVSSLMNKCKYKEKDLCRLSLLFLNLVEDLKNENYEFKDLPEYNYDNIPNSFIKSREFIKNWFEYETTSEDIIEGYFNEINQFLKILYVNNKYKENTYYLLKPKTVTEEIILATYIRKLDYYSDCYNGYKYEEWIKLSLEEMKAINAYKAAFIDFKDFLILGYGVCAATDRRNVRLNVFLTQDAFSKGLYIEDEIISLMANAVLKYGEDNTPLRRFVFDDRFVERYYQLKEEYNKNLNTDKEDV